MPFNRQLLISTPDASRGSDHPHPTAYCTTRTREWCAIISFKSVRQFPTGTSPYSSPCSPNLTTLTTNASCTRENYSRTPSYLCIATIHHSLLRSTARHQIVLGAARCSTTQQMLIALQHLTGDVLGERPELIQPSSIRQTTARPGATRSSHEKGDPEVWFGSRVCILAHEGARGW